MRIRLSEEDATRLGCPTDLQFDFENLSGRDLLELEEQVGWSYETFARALEGTPATNALGGPIYEMNGDVPQLDGMGKPIRAMVLSTKVAIVIVWMCVRKANPDVAWKTFDFNLTKTSIDLPDEPVGKAPRSRKSTPTTRRRSARSSA